MSTLSEVKPLTVKELKEYLSRFRDDEIVRVKLPEIWGNDSVEILEAVGLDDKSKEDKVPSIVAIW